MDLTTLPAWRSLAELHTRSADVTLNQLFAADPGRFERFSADGPALFLDYSKTHVTDEILDALVELAKQAGITAAVEGMFTGQRINSTENRAAMHFALRQATDVPFTVAQTDIRALVRETRDRMTRCAEEIRAGRRTGTTGKSIRSIVHIGIGGSYLGPCMVLRALGHLAAPHIECRFVANADGEEMVRALDGLVPEETLFILVSKSFTTLETRLNGAAAFAWLARAGITGERLAPHLIAITANVEAARGAGVSAANTYPMWDWVGGRYSVWSSAGLVLAIALGPAVFDEFLRGAEEMDNHFRNAPPRRNLPLLMALIGIWYHSVGGADSHAVVPYSHALARFPDFLQQLEMESNGKSVTSDGAPVATKTAPIVWGGEGTNSQHSFHQLFFQGTRLVPVDFILPLRSPRGDPAQHAWVVANCLGQSRALMVGRDLASTVAELLAAGLSKEEAARAAPHRTRPGNCPSVTLLTDQLSPRALGALIALYEHKVFSQGVIWGINSFDQFGVELGKHIAQDIHGELTSPTPAAAGLDSSTRGLVDHLKRHYKSEQ